MSAKKRLASGSSTTKLGLQKYCKELEECPEFRSWLIPDETSPYLARCRFCVGKSYRPNKTTLLKHMESNFHAKNANTQIATCRTCLAKCDSSLMTSIFGTERTTNLTYKDIFHCVTRICVERDKQLPLTICPECCVSVVIAYNFQKKAKIADRTLHMKADPTDVFADLDDTMDDHFTDYEVLDTEFEEYKMSIKVESPTADTKSVLKGNGCSLCSESFDDALALVQHVQAKHKKVMQESPAKKYAAKQKAIGRFKNRKTRPVISSVTGSRANGVHPCHIPILGVLEPKKSKFNKQAEVMDKPRCGVCSELFDDEEELDAHCREHGATEVIMCSLCERVYLKYSYYKRHFQVYHPEMEAVIKAETTETVMELEDAVALEEILQCVRMTSIGDLIHANIEPSDQPVEIEAYVQTCGLCGCIILSPEELKKHNETDHPDFGKQCYYCSKVFHVAAVRSRHLPICKSLDLKYECLICGRRLRREGNLIDHVAKSHPDSFERWSHTREKTTNYLCSKCQAVFHIERELKKHVRVCEEEEEVECDHCHKTFKKKIYLLKHINYQHPVSGVRLKFLCSLCGKGFATDPQLIRHVRTHTKDYPYKCTLCPKGFATLHAFKYHQRTHTGDSPHVCTICNRRFIRGVSLRDHMLIHTGEKPFPCEECGMSFRQKYVLITHVKKIHGGDPNSGRLLIENEDSQSPRTKPRFKISEPFSVKYQVETPEPAVVSTTYKSPVKSKDKDEVKSVAALKIKSEVEHVFVKPKSPSKSHQRRPPSKSLPELI